MLTLQFIFNCCCALAFIIVVGNSPTYAQQQQHDLRKNPKLVKAVELQLKLDSLDLEKIRQRNKLEDRYRRYKSKAIFERNEILKTVPAFWYYALRSTPNSHFFMSPIHHHSHFHKSQSATAVEPSSSSSKSKSAPSSYCGAAGADQCVSNDHDMLKLFLRNVRCHRVHSTPQTSDSRGWTSHQQVLKHKVAVDGLKAALPHDALESTPPNSAVPTETSSDGEFRIELEFESNNIFQERKIFRQVPIHYRRELHAAEIDDNMGEDGAIRAYFGLGTTLKWTGGSRGRTTLLYGAAEENQRLFDKERDENKGKNASLMPRMVSFFSLFDHATLAEVSTNPELESFRKVMQHGLGALVNAVCSHLDHSPIPFYENEFGEESLAALLHLQQHSKHADKFSRDSKIGDSNAESSTSKFEGDLAYSKEEERMRSQQDEMTEEEKELVRVMRGEQ